MVTEEFIADCCYPVGTVVKIGGKFEITQAQFGDLAVGVVVKSINNRATVAIKGRAKLLAKLEFDKGARLVADNCGAATVVVSNAQHIFAIALESKKTKDTHLIECFIL